MSCGSADCVEGAGVVFASLLLRVSGSLVWRRTSSCVARYCRVPRIFCMDRSASSRAASAAAAVLSPSPSSSSHASRRRSCRRCGCVRVPSLIRSVFFFFLCVCPTDRMCEVNRSESVAGLTRIQLENWERAVQRRDSEMLAAPVPEHADLPPPRAHVVIGQPADAKEQDEQQQHKDVSPATSAATAAETPESKKEEEKKEKGVTTPEKRQSLEEAREHAEAAKKKGNTHFGAKQWDAATACYSEAMAYDPTNAVYPANRALCRLKLGDAAAAEQDCTQALVLDARYTKAYYRRAAARRELGKYVLALDDLNMVLQLDPANRQAVEEKRAVNELLAAKVRADETDRVTVVAPEEEGGEETASDEKEEVKEKRVLVEEIASSTSEEGAAKGVEEEEKEEPKPVEPKEEEDKKEEEKEVPKKPTVTIAKPRTFFEFDTQFASLTTDQERAALVRTVPCAQYAAFFKDSLTPSLFARMVAVVIAAAGPDPAEAVAVLDALPTVGRFAILLMTLPAAQKTGLPKHSLAPKCCSVHSHCPYYSTALKDFFDRVAPAADHVRVRWRL